MVSGGLWGSVGICGSLRVSVNLQFKSFFRSSGLSSGLLGFGV